MESHDQPVRASSSLSTTFTLLMARSPGFGSYVHDIFALFTLGFPTPPYCKALRQNRVHKLVGSFFNRHATTDITLRAMSLNSKF